MFANPRYDATWAIILALDAVYRSGGNVNDAAAVMNKLQSVKFEGATGNVSFDANEDRTCIHRLCYMLMQLDMQNESTLVAGRIVEIGKWDQANREFVYGAGHNVIFKDLIYPQSSAHQCAQLDATIPPCDGGLFCHFGTDGVIVGIILVAVSLAVMMSMVACISRKYCNPNQVYSVDLVRKVERRARRDSVFEAELERWEKLVRESNLSELDRNSLQRALDCECPGRWKLQDQLGKGAR